MKLRLATMDDAARLYHWRMDPMTADASTAPPPTSFLGHCEWLEEQLENPSVTIFIGYDTQKSITVGMVRLATDGDEVTVSIAVDPQHRGQGYATQLVAGALESCGPGETKQALVKVGNFVSLRLFWALGFRLAKRQPKEKLLLLVK